MVRSAYTVAGYTGTDPRTVGLAVTTAGTATAVFTTTDPDAGTVLWAADRPAYGLWSTPTPLAEGIVAGSSAFSQTLSGAAVVAWDSTGPDGETSLESRGRPVDSRTWTTTQTLAVDPGLAHVPSVGIDGSARATVAYAHDNGDGSRLFTRQHYVTSAHLEDPWRVPVQQSPQAPVQWRVGVSARRGATLTWTHLNPPVHRQAPTIEIEVRAEGATTYAWGDAIALDDRVIDGGLVDAGTGDDGSGAVLYRTASSLQLSHFTGVACGVCVQGWTSNGLEAVVNSQSAQLSAGGLGRVRVASAVDRGDGADEIIIDETDGSSGFYSGAVTIPAADVSSLRMVAGGVTWTSTTPHGSVLYYHPLDVSGVRPANDGATIALGPATEDPQAEGPAAFWTDPGGSEDFLRTWIPSVSGMVSPTRQFTVIKTVTGAWAPAGSPGSDTRYDVEEQTAGLSDDFVGSTVLSGSTLTSIGIPIESGHTVCLSVRAHDAYGFTTPWSNQLCSAKALDQSALTAGPGWTKQTGSAYYGGSRLTSTTKGSQLRIRGALGRSFALLVSTVPGGGDVYANHTTVGRLTKARTTGPVADRVTVGLYGWSGSLVTKPELLLETRGDHPVSIDGVFISRVPLRR